MLGGAQSPQPPRFAATCLAAPPQLPGGIMPGNPPYGHLEVPVMRWNAETGLANDWASTLYAVAGGEGIFIYEGQFGINGAAPAPGAADTRDLIFTGYMTCPVTDQCMDVTGFGGRPPLADAQCGTNSARRNTYDIISSRTDDAHNLAVQRAGTNAVGQNLEHLAAQCAQEIVDGIGGPVHLMLGPTVIIPAQRPPGGLVEINWDVWPHRRHEVWPGRRHENRVWQARLADPCTPPVIFDQNKWASMTRLRTLALEIWDFRCGHAQEASWGFGARLGGLPTPGSAMDTQDADSFAWIRNWFLQIRAGFAQQNPPHPGLDLLVVAGLNTVANPFVDRYGQPHHRIGPRVDWKPLLQPLLNPNGGRLVLVDFDQIENYDSWEFVEPYEK
ncbi:hypothetical protein RB595_006158 [Gaeumannomyces hyphopodioides]